ncbi:MAG: penicillin acylase family protein [Bacteroidota bacterium]|nr:penicillin acylase family protein [Bacteroidota bacterium]MDP4245061.1 penicillin acylase family protein [Bacteroidota bacterium]
MRIVPLTLSVLLTAALIFCLDTQWGKVPPLGRFLSPQHGFWQNADPLDKSFNARLNFPDLKERAEVYFDDRLVPHIFAGNDEDASFIQGYLHAKFRLWQMEFQVFAAAGRLSEILGPGAGNGYLKYDRQMRRLGMVSGAEKALAEIEKDSVTKRDCDAYTAGVNAYISGLRESELPLEYKLLNYKPEPWSNLKIALFMKYMAYDLAAKEHDFEMTNAKSLFSKEDLAKLYPALQDSLDPIIPRGTAFLPPGIHPKPPVTADSLYFDNKDTVTIRELQPEKNNGSNNWAVSGKKTLSGRPILCNDPHLGTNLPSIWYELQIQTPDFNTYGVSFPGAPFIVIGFNDSCAWGVTNAGRDVRDYYAVEFKDGSRQEYRYNGEWKAADKRFEIIKVKGSPDFVDTVTYTVFGPVMYEPGFTGFSDQPSDKYYAVRWKADDPSNELGVFSRIRSARNYDDYRQAIRWLSTPGQNFIFASKSGDIAITQQGDFPAKWKGQGDYVMPGTDSSYLWQGNIPADENPFILNPERGFVSSANQKPVDTTYPYYLGSDYPVYRGLLINRFLNKWNSITPRDMMKLQTENYDVFAEMARPVLLKHIDASHLGDEERAYLDIIRNWNLRDDPGETGPTIFNLWWSRLESAVYDDELSQTDLPLLRPFESTLLEALLRDTAYKFIDNINTPHKETLREIVTAAFKAAVPDLVQADRDDKLQWGRWKDTWARHLLRLPALSRTHLMIGGGTNCINAAKQFHGPSWRMIVHLTDKTEAYGVYPGGQNGNPGSPYYDSFVDHWAAGKYYPLWVMEREDARDKRVKWKMVFVNNSRP